jgi:signal transduction histidine kinase
MMSLIHKNRFSSKTVENLINDLMDLAKMENNKFKLFENNFDLTQAVSHTLQILLYQASSKEIEFEVKIDHEFNLPLLQNLIGD